MKKIPWKSVVNGALFGVFSAFALVAFYFERYSYDLSIKDRIKGVLGALPVPFAVGIFLGVLLFWYLDRRGERFFHFLYRFRWLIGVVLWSLLIVFKLHGSSIGAYRGPFGMGVENTGLIIGVPRLIRTDEYGSLTPLMLSQYAGANPFSYFSEIVRAVPTDVFLEYGTPVRDIAVVFRPFHWGFLFLNPEHAFSFYWYGRLIALFLVSFETGMWLTKGKKPLAVLTAVLVTFSGIIQWWLGTNGLVEMLVFGQAFVLLVRKLPGMKRPVFRILSAVALAIFGGGYVLTMYPPWMIPLGFIFFVLLLSAVLEVRKEIRFGNFFLPLIVFLVLFSAGMIYVFTKSADTVRQLMATEYPGKALGNGGFGTVRFFSYAGGLTSPLVSGDIENPCERAVFFSFAPLGVLLFLRRLIRKKKADLLSAGLTAVSVILLIYSLVIFPEWLTKITLLNRAASGRVIQVMGFSDILLLVRQLSLRKDEAEERIQVLDYLVIGVLFGAAVITCTLLEYQDHTKLALAQALFTMILYAGLVCWIHGKKPAFAKLGIVLPCLAVLASGGLVNPVSSGLDIVYRTDLMQEIQRTVSEDPDAVWITDYAGYIMNDYAIMGGAKAADSLHVYPDLERFRALDPEGKYEEVYNRYAHIKIVIGEGETTFAIDGARDSFRIDLAAEDLVKTGCRYVLSPRDLTVFDREGLSFTRAGYGNHYTIYRVVYGGE